MRVNEMCAACLYDKQANLSQDREYLKEVLDHADVILAKGQGNYESMCMQGRHIFYSFLCKCDLFTERFGVPRLTGMLVEEKA